MDVTLKSTVTFLVRISVIGVLLMKMELVTAQEDPCDQNSIRLPQEGRCLVLVKNAKDWLDAQKSCERNRGDLYRLSSDYQLASSSEVDACLRAMPSSQNLGNDFWIGAISTWSRHWFWINETLLNPIRYVTQNISALADSPFDVCSNYLSVDYCVSICRDDAAVYTVLHRRTAYYCCFCSFFINTNLVQPVNDSYFLPDSTSFYIAPAREGNLIRLASSDTYSDTETLCAVVNSNTYTSRALDSQTCFSESRFLCSLGNATDCSNPECNGQRCRFLVRGECVQSDGRPMTWFHARAECIKAGGDLWQMGKLDDMYQVAQHILPDTNYWIGATSHFWYFGAESNVFPENPDYVLWRCGHMFVERSGDTGQPLKWKWADTRCDQQKSYICQYEEISFTPEERTRQVICPWEIPSTTTSSSSVTSRSPNVTVTPSVTSTPTSTAANGSYVTEASYVADSSFPIVPIIAACIAALAILLCALFVLGYSRRRKWLREKWRKTRAYMWPFWATRTPTTIFSPSERGFDTLSTGHTNLHGGSDSGSVFAAAAFTYPDPYKTRNHAHRSASDLRDASRRNESFEKGLGGERAKRASVNSADSRHTAMSAPVGRGPGIILGGFGAGRARKGKRGGGGSLSEEHLMASTYSPLSPRHHEYMTLAAHMNIHDDEYSPYSSLGKKPEVALVTPDVDLNFTVNHAYTRHSRPGSERDSERSVEEIDFPGGATIQIPSHIADEPVMQIPPQMVDESQVYY